MLPMLPGEGEGPLFQKSSSQGGPCRSQPLHPAQCQRGATTKGQTPEGGQGTEALSFPGARSFPCLLGLLVEPPYERNQAPKGGSRSCLEGAPEGHGNPGLLTPQPP